MCTPPSDELFISFSYVIPQRSACGERDVIVNPRCAVAHGASGCNVEIEHCR
jgi:hypothetical protein